jgi:hypothetical protein
MKKYLYLLLTIPFFLQAQAVRPFFSLAADKIDLYEKTAFASIAIGVEVKAANFLKPEIAFGYSIGSLNKYNTYTDDFQINGVSQSNFNAFNIGCTPKLLVYKDDNGYYSLNLLPKYTFSKISASNSYAAVLPNGDVVLPSQNSTATAVQHSLGLGIGFCVNFSKKNYGSMAVNLYWNNIEYGNAVNNLKNMGRTINTAPNVGYGLVYYFSIKNNVEKGLIDLK